MIRLLVAAAVLALGLPAAGSPLGTRWSFQPLDGAAKVASGGPGNATLVVLRSGADPLRSFDGGRTWTAFTVNGTRPADVSIAPTDGRTWYAIAAADAAERTPKVVFRTRDGGNSWEEGSPVSARYPIAPQVGPDPGDLVLLSFDLVQEGLPVAPGSFARVLASRDGGRTWTEPNPSVRVNRLVRSGVRPLLAYATGTGVQYGKLIRTLDGGVSWTEVDLPAQGVLPGSIASAHLELDRVQPDTVYVRPEQFAALGSSDLYVTRDGGRSWSRAVVPAGFVIPDPAQAGRVYLAAFDGRYLESRDAGTSWATVDAKGPRAWASNGRDDASMFTVTLSGGVVREAVSVASASLGRLDLARGGLALGSDLWWNPQESGAGFTITQHVSNNPFVAWYTYDASGAPVWRVVPGGAWNDRTFTGDLYETTGPPYFAGAFDPARVASRKVGAATLRFDDENHATFAYAMPGIGAGEKRIERQRFAPPTPASMDSVADLYWSPAEPGWGIVVNHQSSRIFATWFAYGDDGKPLWIVMPDAPVFPQFAGAIPFPATTGDIYTARGPAEGTPFDPAKVVATRVGTATLSWFSQNSAYLEYTAFGKTETRVVRRQPF